MYIMLLSLGHSVPLALCDCNHMRSLTAGPCVYKPVQSPHTACALRWIVVVGFRMQGATASWQNFVRMP